MFDALDTGTNDYELAVFKLSNDYEVQVERDGTTGGWNFEEKLPLANGDTKQIERLVGIEFVFDVWHRVEMKVSLASGSSALELRIDGAATPYTQSLSAHLHVGPPTLRLGQNVTVNRANVRFDDVAVRID